MTDHGHMARIDGQDADALGLAADGGRRHRRAGGGAHLEDAEKQVWDQLRTCFDPEIPVNIVDLGLIYELRRCATVRWFVPGNGAVYPDGARLRHGTISARRYSPEAALDSGVSVKPMSRLVWEPPWSQSTNVRQPRNTSWASSNRMAGARLAKEGDNDYGKS